MRLTTFLKPLSFLPAILLMYMIFSFSAQDAQLSSSISYKVTRTMVSTANRLFDMGLDDYQIDNYTARLHRIVRKLAHMGEYFLLAVAVSFPLYVYGIRGILLVLLAGMICVGFAATDEYHQSFVSGRSMSLKDVGIDSIGILMGIILTRIIGWTGRMTLFRAGENDRYYKSGYNDGYQRAIQENRRQDHPAPMPQNPQQPQMQEKQMQQMQMPKMPEDAGEASDDLAEDMPFSHFLRKR